MQLLKLNSAQFTLGSAENAATKEVNTAAECATCAACSGCALCTIFTFVSFIVLGGTLSGSLGTQLDAAL